MTRLTCICGKQSTTSKVKDFGGLRNATGELQNKRQIAPSNDCNFKEFTVTAEYLAR